MTPPVEQRSHAFLSPSAAKRWMSCPGSVERCKKAPRMPQGKDALEGTCAHEVLERCLKGEGGFLNPFDMVGMELPLNNDFYEVNQEMAEAVSIALETVQEELAIGGKLLVEQKVVYIEGKVYGRLDIAVVRPFDTIVVMDFKYGKGVLVRADYNDQLLIYGLALLKEYECDKMRSVIIQPRARSMEPVSRWECDREFLKDYETELRRKIALTEEQNAPLVPGEHCRWCDGKLGCPALGQEITTALAPVQNNRLVFPPVETWSLGDIKKYLDITDQIEGLTKTVWAVANKILMDGGTIPGYELQKGLGNRSWINDQEVITKFGDELGDKLFEAKVISPAKLEKLIGKKRKDELEELTERKEKEASIGKVGK